MKNTSFQAGWVKLALVALAVSSPSLSFAQNSVRIVDADWMPFFFAGKEGMPQGFGKEILEQCLPSTGFKAEFSFFPIARMFSMMEKGEIDVNVFGRNKNWETWALFGKEPIYRAAYRPVMRKGSKLKFHEIKDFDKLQVGHLSGLKYAFNDEFTAYMADREKQGKGITVYKDTEGAIKMLVEGRIDVFVQTRESISYIAQKAGLADKIEFADYNIASPTYFVAVAKNSPRIKDKEAFLSAIDTCLVQLKKSGKYSSIAKQYGGFIRIPSKQD